MIPFIDMRWIPTKGLNVEERISRRYWKRRLKIMREYANEQH